MQKTVTDEEYKDSVDLIKGSLRRGTMTAFEGIEYLSAVVMTQMRRIDILEAEVRKLKNFG